MRVMAVLMSRLAVMEVTGSRAALLEVTAHRMIADEQNMVESENEQVVGGGLTDRPKTKHRNVNMGVLFGVK